MTDKHENIIPPLTMLCTDRYTRLRPVPCHSCRDSPRRRRTLNSVKVRGPTELLRSLLNSTTSRPTKARRIRGGHEGVRAYYRQSVCKSFARRAVKLRWTILV